MVPADPVQVVGLGDGPDRHGPRPPPAPLDGQADLPPRPGDPEPGVDLGHDQEPRQPQRHGGLAVLGHQRRHPPHHLTHRPPADPGDPPADQPRIGVHGVDHMEPVREQVEPQRQHRRRRLVDRERPHVPVPPPDTDPSHQPHHLDRDLVPAQRRQRPLQRRHPPPPFRLAHPVEQVRVERLHLRHQQSKVGQPPARGGVRAPWATGRRGAGCRGRPARRAGIRGVAPQRPTRPQQHRQGDQPPQPPATHTRVRSQRTTIPSTPRPDNNRRPADRKPSHAVSRSPAPQPWASGGRGGGDRGGCADLRPGRAV